MFTKDSYPSISNAYDGKCIFVTGSSGFLGKVFVEKILYRCPNIDKVYVLMRDSKKANVEEKIKKMLDCPLFKRLKDEKPQDLKKIIPITGDLCKPELGISIEDQHILKENVSMVFHFAATIKFNDPLNTTFNINVEGTRRVLDLCAKIKNLQVIIYVSTAFSNANREVTEEVVYPPVIPLNDIDKILKEDSQSAQQVEEILNGMPNTYTLSKNLAESLAAEFHEKHNLPVAIVRPSIVISCKDEPISGWIDNWFGATALLVAVNKGVIRALCCDGNNILDLIPVDYVSNLVIVAGARCRSIDHIQVYNSSSGTVNPLTLRKIVDIMIKNHKKQSAYYDSQPFLMFIKWKWVMMIMAFVLETIPAFIADFVTRILGKKTTNLKVLSRLNGVREVLEPFTSRTWMMKSQNTSALAATLSPQESRIFACDAADVDWNDLIPKYLQGVQKYLLDNKT